MSGERPLAEIQRVIHILGLAEREASVRQVLVEDAIQCAAGRRGAYKPTPGPEERAIAAIQTRYSNREISADQAIALSRTPAMMAARLGPGSWPTFQTPPQVEIERPRRYGEPVPFTRAPLRSATLEGASDDEIRVVRHAALVAVGHETARPLVCHDVAASLATVFPDARMEGGHFIGPRGPDYRWGKRGDRHSWVRTTRGSLIDAAADQFGYLEIIRIPAGDPRLAWYEILPPRLNADGTWIHGEYIETRPHQLPATHEPLRILY